MNKNDLHRIIFDNARDGIVMLNQEHRVIEANQTFAKMLGYSQEELSELYVWDWEALMTKEDIKETFKDISNLDETIETRHRRKDGTMYDVEISIIGTQYLDQSVSICICRDITDRKKTEDKLRESTSELEEKNQELEEAVSLARNANEAKSSYLAHMNHEMRTPLNGFIGFLQLMESTPMNQEQQEYMYHMKQSSGHMLSIINNVLDYAKIEAGELELDQHTFHLEDEVRAALAPLLPLAQQQSLSLELSLDS